MSTNFPTKEKRKLMQDENKIGNQTTAEIADSPPGGDMDAGENTGTGTAQAEMPRQTETDLGYSRSLPSRRPEENSSASSQNAQEKTDEEARETREGPGGFSHFRNWANRRLSEGRQVKILYNSEPCPVEELTPYGELRLKVGDSFAMVPFIGRDIPEFLRQLL